MYDGRLCFHRCMSVQLWGGYPISGLGRGVPHPGSRSRGVPSPRSGGVPHPRSRGDPIPGPGGVLWVPPHPDQVWIRQSSTASTSYAAGGVPLAFTQEDFLVNTK